MTAFTSAFETCVSSAIASMSWFLVILDMMDSFVEAQNDSMREIRWLRCSYSSTAKPQESLPVHAEVMRLTGLKPIRSQNTRLSSKRFCYRAGLPHQVHGALP